MKGSSKKSIINEFIEAEKVRLVGADGSQLGVVSIEEARVAAAATPSSVRWPRQRSQAAEREGAAETAASGTSGAAATVAHASRAR